MEKQEIFIRKCEYCNKEFETKNEFKRFCCRSCKEKAKNIRIKKGISNIKIYTKICENCGREYQTNTINQKYCSEKCKNDSKKVHYDFNLSPKNIRTIKSNINKFIKQKIKEQKLQQTKLDNTVICPVCGKEFVKKRKEQKYCSIACIGVSQRKTNDLIEHKLRSSLMYHLQDSINNKGIKYKKIVNIKDLDLENILGCSFAEYKIYLESKFQEGMNWDNYGRKKDNWQIDHIIPCTDFKLVENNLINIQELCECFNYKNTQPLWSLDNASKGNKNYDEWLSKK